MVERVVHVNLHASGASKPFILRAVERPVKERLVGAAVLMAAAIILIPEMLSGPDRESAEQQAQSGEGGESAIKTYTIDLNQSPGALPPSTPEQTDNRAPPPEEMPPSSASPPTASPPDEPIAEPQTSPESVVVAAPESPAELTPAPQPRQSEPAPAVVAETPRSEPRPQPRSESPRGQAAAQPARAEAPPAPKAEIPPARPVASAPAAPKSAAPAATATGKGWVVQLGSYSSEATAQRLMNEWRGKGFSAFVMPVAAGGKTLYRVRLGPTKDRAASEAALKSVKPSIPSAAVVAHP